MIRCGSITTMRRTSPVIGQKKRPLLTAQREIPDHLDRSTLAKILFQAPALCRQSRDLVLECFCRFYSYLVLPFTMAE